MADLNLVKIVDNSNKVVGYVNPAEIVFLWVEPDQGSPTDTQIILKGGLDRRVYGLLPEQVYQQLTTPQRDRLGFEG
jgi:hypothetical protein